MGTDGVAGWRDRMLGAPRLVSEIHVCPRKSALLIVDMQNYAIKTEFGGLAKIVRDKYPDRADSYFGRVNELVVPNIQVLLSLYRQYALRVVFVTVGPELSDASDYFSRRRRRDKGQTPGYSTIFPRGTAGHEIIEELRPLENELVVNKTSTSPFNSTAIDQVLRNMGITSLVVAGVGTLDVETTARDAADRGYEVYLVEDACASLHPQLHDASMLIFSMLFGVVKTTREIVEEFQAKLRTTEMPE